MKQLPRVWPHIYREHLNVRLEALDGDGARVVFEDIAPAVLAVPGYLVLWEAILIALVGVCDYDADATWERDPARRAGSWTLRWRPR